MPRPSLLTGTVAAAIARAVQAGIPRDTAAVELGLNRGVVGRWYTYGDHDYADVPDQITRMHWLRCVSFRRRVDQALAQREARAVRRITGLIESADKDQVSLNAALGLLERHPSYRERWGKQTQLVHSGTVTQQQLTVTLTPAEARSLYEAVRASRALPAPHSDQPL